MQQELVDNNNNNKREEKGKVIAANTTVYKIIGKDIFYVESESTDSMFYYIGYSKIGEYEWCSCLDNSIRQKRCKHIFAVEESIRQNKVVEKEGLPSEVPTPEKDELQYKGDEYSF